MQKDYSWLMPEGFTHPVNYHSGTCYDTAYFNDEAAAKRFAEHIRNQGNTVNGGLYHGTPLGQFSKASNGNWMVIC